jgi:hypothetical protein
MRAALLAAALVALLRPSPVEACAPVFPEGASVSISGEEALIVWNAEARVEHFIRRADFQTDAEDFGFLVPTPSEPELSEVDGGVFSRIDDYRQPEIRYVQDWQPVTCCTAPFLLTLAVDGEAEAVAAVQAPAVEVLQETRVAGLDATVLRAADAGALSAWLGEHGYDDRPALVEWLAPYVDAGFAITAFRFEKRAEVARVSSQAIRMTFETQRPFYPYREPSDHPAEPGRALWLHLVAAERASGELDGEWAPETLFAAPIDDVASVLGDAQSGVTGPLWLTTIIDRSSTRTDADLSFTVARGEELRPEPRVLPGPTKPLWLPFEPLVLGGVGFWWWRRRKRAASRRAQ